MRVPFVLVSLVCFAAACGSVESLNGDGGHDGSGSDGGSDGSGSDTSGGYKSGTRLKYEWYSFDGVKLPSAIYDSQLGFECQTASTDDTGHTVLCLPPGAQAVYADAACTMPVAMVYPNGSCTVPAPTYGIEETYDGCAEIVSAVYPVTNTTPTTLTQYYSKNMNGTCGLPTATEGQMFYALGTAVDLSMFATITLPQTQMSGNRLTQQLASSSDGFTLPNGFYDSTLQDTCNLYASWQSADHAVCGPQPSAYDNSLYSNAACTSHVAEYNQTCTGADAPKYAQFYDPNASNANCPYRDPVYDSITGQGVMTSTAYYGSSGQCFQENIGNTTLYPTDAVPVGIASIPRSPDSTGHTIELVHETSDGKSYLDFTMYDTVHHAYCSPETLSDGSVHCINYQYQTQQYYTDANCTAQADFVLVYSVPSGCTSIDPPEYAVKYTGAQSCNGAAIEIHEVTQLFSGTLYQNFGSCQAQTFSGYNIYQVGATIPVNQFPTATVVRDP